VVLITPWARSRRSGQLTTWFLGLLIFFDDYANTLLLGSTMQPTCDRLRISREKLAYIVDSTAAPVAGLALISTWIAIELDYIRDGLSNLDPAVAGDLSPFELFVACIPYRFYMIQALVFVPLVAIMRRDFGPMLRAESRIHEIDPQSAARLGSPKSIHNPQSEIRANPYDDGQPIRASHWAVALAPIAVTLVLVVYLIYRTGEAAITESDAALTGFARFRQAFGSGNSGLGLCYGGLGGLAVAIVLGRWWAGVPTARIKNAVFRGARVVLPALAILWLAGAMSRMTGNKSVDGRDSTAYEYSESRLYTGDFISEQLQAASEGESAAFASWLPTVVFLLAATVSFCTGTSFGTMGILVPMVVPLASATLPATGPTDLAGSSIFLASLGSVLAGAVFGDHCSPISDTTILSSQASGCDHMAHVATQLPYAFVVAGVVTVLGTVLVGQGVSVWLLLPLQTAVLIGLLRIIGKPVEDRPTGQDGPLST